MQDVHILLDHICASKSQDKLEADLREKDAHTHQLKEDIKTTTVAAQEAEVPSYLAPSPLAGGAVTA